MRLIPAAISFTLLSLLSFLPAAAQRETVTVTAESLPGLWKIGFPAWSYRTFLNVKFGPIYDDFCRLAGTRDDLHVACLSARFRVDNDVQQGAVTLRGNSLHILWGGGFLAGALDLAQQSTGIFTGTFSMRFFGVPFGRSDELHAVKIIPAENTVDADGKSALLAKLLNSITEGTPGESPVQLREGMIPPAGDDLRPLGRLDALIYLGRTSSSAQDAALYKDMPQPKEETSKEGMPKEIPPPAPPPSDADASSVYAAEFDKGERLCAIYQRPDGVVEDLRCI